MKKILKSHICHICLSLDLKESLVFEVSGVAFCQNTPVIINTSSFYVTSRNYGDLISSGYLTQLGVLQHASVLRQEKNFIKKSLAGANLWTQCKNVLFLKHTVHNDCQNRIHSFLVVNAYVA